MNADAIVEEVRRNRAAIEEEARRGYVVKGLIGPADQVEQAKQALGVRASSTKMDERENLYSLKLDELLVPEALAKLPAPRRSVLFVCFSGSERGMLGSGAFAAVPRAPPGPCGRSRARRPRAAGRPAAGPALDR